MWKHIDYTGNSPAGYGNFGGTYLHLEKCDLSQRLGDKTRPRTHRPKSRHVQTRLVWTAPLAALCLVGNWSAALADTSDVKGPATLIVAKSGEHCKDDPNCFNRIHYAVKPVAHAMPGQLFVLETRDGLDSDLNFESTAADVAAVDLNRCHPLTGPVYIEGAKRGDSIAVTVVDIAPDDFGTTTIVPGFGFLRDVFPDPYIVHWQLNRLDARSKDMPGIAVPNNAFMGTVGVLPDKPELDKWLKREKVLAEAGGAVLTPQPVEALPADLCGVDGTAKDECVRTVPPRENGGNLDTKETVVGTTIHFPCFIDGCGLFAGDVHFAMGGGEVAGTAIEMGAKVTLRAKVIPGGASLLSTVHFEGGPQLKKLAPSSFYAVSGLSLKPEGELPIFDTYLGGQKIAPLANLSEDLTLAARNATLNMIDFLVKTKGLTREQAYILTSVAVDLNIAQVVDVPNMGVTAILNRDVFEGQQP
jgi:formamidase